MQWLGGHLLPTRVNPPRCFWEHEHGAQGNGTRALIMLLLQLLLGSKIFLCSTQLVGCTACLLILLIHSNTKQWLCPHIDSLLFWGRCLVKRRNTSPSSQVVLYSYVSCLMCNYIEYYHKII